MIADAHCHFFSSGFFEALGREAGVASGAAATLPERLGWESPGDDRQLGARWAAELDRCGVSRAMLIASVPGDEDSVARARDAHPERIVGAFMVNPAGPDAAVGGFFGALTVAVARRKGSAQVAPAA